MSYNIRSKRDSHKTNKELKAQLQFRFRTCQREYFFQNIKEKYDIQTEKKLTSFSTNLKIEN